MYNGRQIDFFTEMRDFMNTTRKNTVKQTIFILNTSMVIVILSIAFIVNYFFAKLYLSAAETDFEKTLHSAIPNNDAFEDTIEAWTVKRQDFMILFSIDGVICVIVLLFVSFLFTKKLAQYITLPLNKLINGAKHVKNGDLSQEIIYKGLYEFETACENFNKMQKHILDEQTKNLKYEKARTDMVAGISHDLRTPLTAIQGTLKGLIDGIASTPEIKEKFLNTAYKRSLDMERLIEKLFFFSKMETGNMPLNMQTVDLSHFIEQYINTKKDLYSYDTLTIKYIKKTDNDSINIKLDTEQLIRIFDNLIENSLKYANVPSVIITISLIETKEHATIVFADNGTGVPTDKLPHIFDEFYRCDESRNKKDGNGLGLYIVKYLITEMNGNIEATNDNGLCIYINFPITKEIS